MTVLVFYLVLIMEPVAASNLYHKTLKIIEFDDIVDLGNTEVMSFAGTLGWMAPEVLNSNAVSKANDVWRSVSKKLLYYCTTSCDPLFSGKLSTTRQYN